MFSHSKPISYAVIFPGQGSQSLAMLDNWGDRQAIVDAVLLQANDALGYDLGEVISLDPEGVLNHTSVTQPAMLTAGYIAWKIWKKYCADKHIVLPAYLAGHSLGEYTALVAANVLDFSDAVRLVEYRGQCMQDAVAQGEGAMAAILGLDDLVVKEVCESLAAEGIVEAVNFNAPGQVVIAGEKQFVEVAIDQLKVAGARRALMLPVSVPSHCQLMLPAARKLENYLAEVNFNPPQIPVVHNVDVAEHQDVNSIKRVLVEQLHKPVRWVECMQSIAAKNVTQVIECGPGKVLSGLQRRINRDVMAYPLFNDESLGKLATEFSVAEDLSEE